jgi:hypothetical protein
MMFSTIQPMGSRPVKPPSIAPCRHLGRHAVGEDGDRQRRQEARPRGHVGLQVQEAQADQHHHHRTAAKRVEIAMLANGLYDCCQTMLFSSIQRLVPALRGSERNDGETSDALRAAHQHALDVGGGRRAGHQHRVARFEEVALAIRVMKVGHDRGRVEQHHQVLRQEAERIDAELAFAQPHRAGFGHAEGRTDDAHVDVVQLARVAHVGDRTGAAHLGRGGADHACHRKSLEQEAVERALGRRLRDDAAHAGERGREAIQRRRGPADRSRECPAVPSRRAGFAARDRG